MNNKNKVYYHKRSKDYINETISIDMSFEYDLFLKYINTKSPYILDLGFGSGRDMLYFKDQGYKVDGLDESIDFINNMKDKGFTLYHEDIENITFTNKYDAIWASASLLHIKRCKLKDVFIKLYASLKLNGIVYCSFKYGDYEGIVSDRFYTYMNESLFNEIIKDTPFIVEEMVIKDDSRSNDTKWLNIILRKEEENENFVVIDTETTFSDEVMSIGIALSNNNTYSLIDYKYYIITPTYKEGGMYMGVLVIENDYHEIKLLKRCEAIKDINDFLYNNNVKKIFAYNACFDYNHLPELHHYNWYDIMRIAGNVNYNNKIPFDSDISKSGRLKKGYGVESIYRLLSDNRKYHEIHNALYDSIDELKIMEMLGHSLDIYELAKINK